MSRVQIDPSARVGRGTVLEADDGARIMIGAGAEIGDGTRIHARAGTVSIGEGSVLGERCALVAHAGIEIGRSCLLGDGVVICDFDPITDDVETPVRLQGLRTAPVTVGAGARVGHGASLTAGAVVEAGATVAVHAVTG